MAILEKATNNYYKIEFDRCAVRGLKVFVSFSVYKSAEERDKEKQRESLWAEFFRKLRESLHTQYTGLLAAIEAQGLTPEQVLCATEDDKIDLELYPELRAAQDKFNALQPFETAIAERLFQYGDSIKPEIEIPESVLSELKALGFEEDWITDPVEFNGGAEVNTGDYNGEPITHELFYERLKSIMGETEDC